MRHNKKTTKPSAGLTMTVSQQLTLKALCCTKHRGSTKCVRHLDLYSYKPQMTKEQSRELKGGYQVKTQQTSFHKEEKEWLNGALQEKSEAGDGRFCHVK